MKFSLPIKYSILSILLIVTITVIMTLVFVNQYANSLEKQIIAEANYSSKILEASVAENIVTLRVARIRENIYFLKQNPLIEYAYVMDQEGRILSDGIVWGSEIYQIPNDNFQEKAMQATSTIIQEDENYFDVATPIKLGQEYLGHLRVGFTKKTLKEEVREFTFTAIALGFGFVLIGSVFTFFIIKKLSNPLVELTKLTHDISDGRFDGKINITTNDELSELAESFNNMSDKLAEVSTSLIKAKEDAERSNELKTEFLAQISHEIRTPINTMLSYASLIEENGELKKGSEEDDYFEIMRNAGKRITRTIDLILNMSEVQKGSYNPTFEHFNIHTDVLKSLYDEFSSPARMKNLDFSIESNCDSPFIYADKYTTIQIFQNLIDNAIKYTSSGYVKIKIDNCGENLRAIIEDSGEGISEEFQKTMFEPFRQEEQGYTRKYEGSGLGLALVFKYCELNNAMIKVNSKKGSGTSFFVRFPIK